jgi:Putative zinc-finger
MLTMNCADVRRELSAYHDEEMSIGQRIAMRDHLDNCPGCAVEADDLLAIRDALHAENRAEQVACAPLLSRIQSDVFQRRAAEDSVSLTTWIGELLEDRRRAFATTGASLAACVLIIAGVCQLGLGTKGHPDSLAALLEHEEQVWALRAETPVLLPRVNPETVMPAAVLNQGEGEESYSAFAALVTSEGNLSKLEFLGDEQALARKPFGSLVSQKQLESDLLAAAATASFQPASKAGEPVPLNVIWIVTHRTVRGTNAMRARVEVTSTFRFAKTV